jgi:dienelactone hydrolase
MPHLPLVLLAFTLFVLPRPDLTRQATASPETVIVKSGALTLRALLWRPPGQGPFPAVLFNHGSYTSAAPMNLSEPAALGPVFARHGYVVLFLFRQGIGLSANQGTLDGDLMARALASGGQAARNRVQLELLETEEMNAALAGLALLRARPDADARRIALAGHSFGGSLSLLLAARDANIRAAVVFGAAAASWKSSPARRARLLTAVGQTAAAVLFLHTANDYSTTPGEALAAEMRRRGKPHRLKIYPAVGRTTREGHNFLFRNVSTWESDVFAFLDQHVKG